jgi:micrococcal nuclease
MYTYKAKVLRVIDGDTIVVDIDLGFYCWLFNQSIRLAGIDAPETRTKNSLEKEAGLLAKSFVEDYIKPGDMVVVTTIFDKTEKFGRILGTITTENGLNINQALLDENLVVAYDGQSNQQLAIQHEANLKLLMERKLIGTKNS